MHITYIGIAIMKCQGHEYSLQKVNRTVIKMNAHPDKAAQHRARYNRRVAATLKSLGIKQEVERIYVHGSNKLVKNRLKYTIDVQDREKTKYLVKKFSEILPEYLDQDDVETVYQAFNDLTAGRRQERQIEVIPLDEVGPSGQVFVIWDDATFTATWIC